MSLCHMLLCIYLNSLRLIYNITYSNSNHSNSNRNHVYILYNGVYGLIIGYNRLLKAINISTALLHQVVRQRAAPEARQVGPSLLPLQVGLQLGPRLTQGRPEGVEIVVVLALVLQFHHVSHCFHHVFTTSRACFPPVSHAFRAAFRAVFRLVLLALRASAVVSSTESFNLRGRVQSSA